jgi:uncharacterized membrane protein YcaP (DUF421 family)
MNSDITPFDLHRMFIGDLSPWFYGEIIFRTAFLYLAAILLLRLMGKRGMSSLSPFEQVILIALGSAVGDPMFYPEVPLLYAVTVMAVIMGMHRLIAGLIQRSDSAQEFIEGHPTRLIWQGQIDKDNLQSVQLNTSDLHEALRVNGIEFLEEVRAAYLEVSGELSVYPYEGDVQGKTSILPEEKQDAG